MQPSRFNEYIAILTQPHPIDDAAAALGITRETVLQVRVQLRKCGIEIHPLRRWARSAITDRAIEIMRSHPIREVSKILGVAKSTISEWHKRLRAQGVELYPVKKGRPRLNGEVQ